MRRTSLLICGVAVVAAALTACGSTINGSAAATSGNGPATSSGGGGVGGAITVAQLGNLVSANTNKQQTAHIDMQVTGTVAMSMTGSVKFGNPMAMDQTMNMPVIGGSMEVIVVDNTAYIKLPSALAQAQHVTTPWVKIDPNGTDPMDKAMASQLQNSQQNADPTAILNKIKSAGTITSTKQEQVNGQNATHYTIAVDPKKLTGNMPGLGQQMAGLLPSNMTVDYWVNSDNLPVRAADSVSLSVQGTSITENIVANYRDWGQPVNIAAPPANQVGTFGGH